MTETLCNVLPYCSEITKQKKRNILASFEEVEYYSSETILEREGLDPRYVYWILEGEILIYKKMPGLYLDKVYDDVVEDKLVEIDGKKPLHLFATPTTVSKKQLGVKIGSIKGHNIIADSDVDASRYI